MNCLHFVVSTFFNGFNFPSINGSASATVTGVTVSNIVVSVAGVVTADVVADCTSSNAAFTLRVTDSNGAFSEATLNVAVTGYVDESLGHYADAFTFHLSEEVCKKLSANHYDYTFDFAYSEKTEQLPNTKRIKLNHILLVGKKPAFNKKIT